VTRNPPRTSRLQPWEVLESALSFSDTHISVRTDTVRTRGGDVIKSFHVVTLADWAAVVGLTPEFDAVLVHNYRHGAEEIFLELPAGKIDPEDASAEAGALREFSEETGYSVGEVSLLRACYPNPGRFPNRVHGYLALDCTPAGPQQLDHGEEIEVITMPFVEAVEEFCFGARLEAGLHIMFMQQAAIHILRRPEPRFAPLQADLRALLLGSA